MFHRLSIVASVDEISIKTHFKISVYAIKIFNVKLRPIFYAQFSMCFIVPEQLKYMIIQNY